MTTITDRILARMTSATTAIYLGHDERGQFEDETVHHLVHNTVSFGDKSPDGAFAEYHGLPVYEVDAQSHFGLGADTEKR